MQTVMDNNRDDKNSIQFLKRPRRDSVSLELTHCGSVYVADALFLSKNTAFETAYDLIGNSIAQDVLIVYFDGEVEGMEYAVFRR